MAAKEAVYKAMQSLPGAPAKGWGDIEVTRDAEGRPAIRLTDGQRVEADRVVLAATPAFV